MSPLGRPRDAQLEARFLDAGIRLLAAHGMHRFTVDQLVGEVHAGKGGFYRRWPTIDHYFAAVTRRLAEAPADYSAGGGLPTALAELVARQVAGEHGAAAAALLSRTPYSPVLRRAWVTAGPPVRFRIDLELLVRGAAGLGRSVDVLHDHLWSAVLHLRERRLLEEVPGLPWVPAAQAWVDAALRDVAGQQASA